MRWETECEGQWVFGWENNICTSLWFSCLAAGSCSELGSQVIHQWKVMCSTTVSKSLPYPEQNIPSNSLLNAQKSNISASHSPQCSDLAGKYQCLKFREREVSGCFPTLRLLSIACPGLDWNVLGDLGISTGCHSEALNALPGDSPWNYHFTCWSALWCDPETHLDRLGMIPGELFFN